MLDNQARNAKILVMGVGGGGCNAVNSMIASGVESAEFVAVNTDAQAINMSKAENRITIGASITRGLGAGSRPDVGKQAANESRNELDKALDGVDMLFITAGMGGGTGTGAAPVIAQMAKDMGILTIAVVTKPFPFEGRIRASNAEKGIANLKKYVDTLVIIPNEKLLKVMPKGTSVFESFKRADEVLRQGIQGISDLILKPGIINLDFADVKTVMKNRGYAHMGIGLGKGENKVQEAVRNAVYSPLLETQIEGATAVLLNIKGGVDMALDEINEASELVREVVDPNCNIIFGTSINENMKDEVEVTIIATGFTGGSFDQKPEQPRTQTPYEKFFGAGVIGSGDRQDANAQAQQPYAQAPFGSKIGKPNLFAQQGYQQSQYPNQPQQQGYNQQYAQPQYNPQPTTEITQNGSRMYVEDDSIPPFLKKLKNQ